MQSTPAGRGARPFDNDLAPWPEGPGTITQGDTSQGVDHGRSVNPFDNSAVGHTRIIHPA